MIKSLGRIVVYVVLCAVAYILLKGIFIYNDIEFAFGGAGFWLGFSWALMINFAHHLSGIGGR